MTNYKLCPACTDDDHSNCWQSIKSTTCKCAHPKCEEYREYQKKIKG